MECLIGIFNVIHSHIGQLKYDGRSGQMLANTGIFFYDHFYRLHDRRNSRGSLQKINLQPDWNYMDWPILDTSVLESVKSKMYKDVQPSLRGSIATKIVKIVMFMPITIFVDLFSAADVRITKTMLICKNLNPEFSKTLLDEDWFIKEVDNVSW